MKFEKFESHELNPKSGWHTKAELCAHIEECYKRIDKLFDDCGTLEVQLMQAREDQIRILKEHRLEIREAVTSASAPLPVTIEGAAKVTIG